MVRIVNLLKKILLCFFALYGFNIIGVHFNYVLPINVFSILIVFLFDFPGIVCLILLKMILWGFYAGDRFL